ncbi:MAG TPA: hypothetical protein VH591_01165 [Ktedonobacterales bacterium]
MPLYEYYCSDCQSKFELPRAVAAGDAFGAYGDDDYGDSESDYGGSCACGGGGCGCHD